MPDPTRRRWELATDADEVHALLCASDAHQAVARAPAPVRNPLTTRQRVADGTVHVLRDRNVAVGTFTLLWTPPFNDVVPFPTATKPAYLCRLAVAPAALIDDALIGVRCLRRAVEVAVDAGADAVRAEANPDLTRVSALLESFGFERCGPVHDGPPRRVYLQKTLP